MRYDTTTNRALLPIESAPKDREILALCPAIGWDVFMWDPHIRRVAESKPYWKRVFSGMSMGFERMHQPTHWALFPGEDADGKPLPDVDLKG